MEGVIGEDDMASSSSSSSSDSEVEEFGVDPTNERGHSPPPPHRIGSGCQVILDRVTEEEAQLRRTVKELRETLGEANRLLVRRQDEVRELKARKGDLQTVTGGRQAVPGNGGTVGGEGQLHGGQGQSLGSKRKKKDADEDEDEDDEEGSKSKRLRGEHQLGEEEVVEVNPALDVVEELEKVAELILPEEVWELIFQNLKAPADLWNTSKTCRLFKRISQPISLWLFDMVFPLLFNYLDSTLILKLRSVCKRWNLIIDDLFENHQSLRPHPGHGDASSRKYDPRSPPFITPMEDKKMGLYRFSNFRSDLRSRFTLEMRDHPRNPFIGRSLSIVELYVLEEDDFVAEEVALYQRQAPDGGRGLEPVEMIQRVFWAQLNRFMKVFGQHIWYLTFSSEYQDQPSNFGRRALHKFLAQDVFLHCPNLRKLRLGGHLPDFYEGDNLFNLPFMNLPDMPQLESIQHDELHYSMNQCMPDEVVRRYCGQLGALHLRRRRLNHMAGELMRTGLTELHLKMFKVEGHLNILQSMELPQLRRLGLSLDPKGITKSSFGILLTELNKLAEGSPHLCALRLNTGFPEEDLLRLPRGLDLYAPSAIKTLEIRNHASVAPSCGYTFLLRFPSLENLNIYWPTRRPFLQDEGDNGEDDDGVLRHLGIRYREEADFQYHQDIEAELELEVMELHKFMYRKRVYESSIWKLLPRLNILTFQRELYSRHGYEEFEARRGRRRIQNNQLNQNVN